MVGRLAGGLVQRTTARRATWTDGLGMSWGSGELKGRFSWLEVLGCNTREGAPPNFLRSHDFNAVACNFQVPCASVMSLGPNSVSKGSTLSEVGVWGCRPALSSPPNVARIHMPFHFAMQACASWYNRWTSFAIKYREDLSK